MTSIYTHTRPETKRSEIFRAVQLWPDSLAFARKWVHARASQDSPAQARIDVPAESTAIQEVLP